MELVKIMTKEGEVVFTNRPNDYEGAKIITEVDEESEVI